MRAVQVQEFGPPSGLVVAEVPDPEPGPGEVVIAVAAAGVNFPDILVVEGTYQNLPERPFSPGKEAAGTVLAVGEGVERLAVGQRVLTLVEHGAFTEQLLVPEELVVALPDEITFEQAAAFGLVYSTAYFGLVRRARLSEGEWVLVTGAGGGVGSAGVQLAKALGATVIALARDEERARLAREQGADVALTSDASTLRDDLLRVTGGHGVDVTLEMVGGDVLTQVVRATAWEGRVVIVGFASGGQNPIKPGHLLVKNISVVGLQSSDYRDRTPELMRSTMEEMLQLFVEGRITIPVDSTFPLGKTGDALQAVKDGGIKGKVVIVPERA
ncbi:NADPH:quinone oxidoreductase family protein [Prauserella cavernicola]|uniref:NADPH:quinone oxidoreductase family protein n=1 Tax=Prauserella cavernicola TaxID=2800127 RepID=A0A934R1D0_9PSEU|nr:NADPH:quinone oxidoreductase family protein [Prauserella cavernicola]MBK1789038.1 NADPH:quinone oxidoreductase family protein [Prauserella cavernicola]